MQVTKDMTMGEIIQKWPDAAGVMQEYGLHCFGCYVNLFETLEQGVTGHGMSETDMKNLLNDLNKLTESAQEVKEEKHEPGPLVLTPFAAEKLKELAEKNDFAGRGIRVQALKGGCAGYTYSMDFTDDKKEGDAVIEQHGVKLFVDSDSSELLKGTTIDYVESLKEAGFKFENPNAHASCGCGKSFR